MNKYDTKIDKFPGVVLAGVFGFDQMPRYKSDSGAEKAPNVDFKF